jgi:mono/diheme cytochrome c family protein
MKRSYAYKNLCRSVIAITILLSRLALGANAPVQPAPTASDGSTGLGTDLQAVVIAIGIPGAGAVAEVGPFLTGSPIHDRTTTFALFTTPGNVLDPKRVLVASTSNFGAPLARPNDPEGTILSIDPFSDRVSIPGDFASAGGQSAGLNGRVQVYAAQNPIFLNGLNNTSPLLATADLPATSLPTGISINNGNGRPWIANAPNGASGNGTITVLDPQGYPLANGPDPVAGGVFAGELTNRDTHTTHGLTSAALGTAILSKSPDLTGRAVFAAVEADGSVVQIHVLKGVDQLAPPRTVTPIVTLDRHVAESTHPATIARVGMAFNWVPVRNLFIADPKANRLVVLDITDDGTLFHATSRKIHLPQFNLPIDIAPTTREVAAGSFASNTTLSGGSDLYVLNRGNNSIVRMTITGEVQAVRRIHANLPDFRVNGIAVSADGQTLYVTANTANGGGALMAVPAFGATRSTTQFVRAAREVGKSTSMNEFGSFLFSLAVTPEQGLGPLFNQASCGGCHRSPALGGMGLLTGEDEQLVGRRLIDGSVDPLTGHGGPVARAHSITELGIPCDLSLGIPRRANTVSLRNAMSLRGNGLIDDIAPGDLLANAASEPDAVRGHPNILADGRIGKFGWKADVATLVEFMGEAFRNEMGLTNPLSPQDEVTGCGAQRKNPEIDALALQATAAFLNTIDPPAPAAACINSAGATVFQSIGCANCHTPALPGPGARGPVRLYSDLLLHDMGSGLADQMQQGSARGNEWRTMPLWRVSERGKFLHDGRATTLTEAILAHGGQAQDAQQLFQTFDDTQKVNLLDFLGCL